MLHQDFHVGVGVMHRLSIVRQSVIFHIFDVVLICYTCAVHISRRQVRLIIIHERSRGIPWQGLFQDFAQEGGKHIVVNFKGSQPHIKYRESQLPNPETNPAWYPLCR